MFCCWCYGCTVVAVGAMVFCLRFVFGWYDHCGCYDDCGSYGINGLLHASVAVNHSKLIISAVWASPETTKAINQQQQHHLYEQNQSILAQQAIYQQQQHHHYEQHLQGREGGQHGAATDGRGGYYLAGGGFLDADGNIHPYLGGHGTRWL